MSSGIVEPLPTWTWAVARPGSKAILVTVSAGGLASAFALSSETSQL
jgi:hypothetical protein